MTSYSTRSHAKLADLAPNSGTLNAENSLGGFSLCPGNSFDGKEGAKSAVSGEVSVVAYQP